MTKQQLWSVPAELKLEVMRGTKSSHKTNECRPKELNDSTEQSDSSLQLESTDQSDNLAVEIDR